jgi:hypothetical protein
VISRIRCCSSLIFFLIPPSSFFDWATPPDSFCGSVCAAARLARRKRAAAPIIP